MRKIAKAPKSVIENGGFQYGCYNQPIEKVNLLDAKIGGLGFAKNFKLREWQAFQLYSDQGWFIMAALYNTKKVCLVQFIVYNTRTKKKIRCEKKVLPRSLSIPSGLHNTTASHRSKGFSFEVKHDVYGFDLTMNVHIDARKSNPRISANFRGLHDCGSNTPMVTCMPFSQKRGMYSHKCLMPVEGELWIGDELVSFEKESSSIIIDDHKGFYPYRTKYDWATALGFGDNGVRVGFNLTDNQVLDQERYNENCYWSDGEMVPLPPVKFVRPNGCKGKWLIQDQEGLVDLEFTPEIHNSVRLNLLLLASKYEGPYGVFNGKVRSVDGRVFEVSDLFGMGEQFYLRS